jgi:hypothetical protein
MNPFSIITSPINNLWDAIAAPFRAVFVVGLCYFINRFTSPGADWWHWVAFGMTISVIVAWARAFKTIALLIAVYYVGRWVYGKYGDGAKAKFDEWVNGKAAASTAAPQPKEAKDVLRLIGSDSAVQQAGIVA